MNVLIVAATELEIAPLLNENKHKDILITGVGIPATVFHLTKKLTEKDYDYIIQAGIAGTFTDRHNIEEVVLVKEDTFADIGIEEKQNFSTLFDTGLMDKNEFPFKNGLLINNSTSIKTNELSWARSVTVNKITDNPFQIKAIQEKYSAEIESMEGAAFQYVCLQQKTPFLQMRSISNKVGERDKTKWNLKGAIRNLNKELFNIIENLK